MTQTNLDLQKQKWNADLYDKQHSFVSDYGTDLIELLRPNKGEIILDVGCGTGDLTNKLSALGAVVKGVDQSETMIKRARNKYPKLNFEVGNAVQLQYLDKFDAVFSNAVLHWIKEPEKALSTIHKSLKEGGRFVAEFGGKGNVEMITTEIRNQFNILGIHFNEERFPWFFPSVGEYTTLMERVGFHVTFACHFNRPTRLEGINGLRNWMDMFANLMFEHLDKQIMETIISNTEKNLKDQMFNQDHWISDYKRIRVVGIKERKINN